MNNGSREGAPRKGHEQRTFGSRETQSRCLFVALPGGGQGAEVMALSKQEQKRLEALRAEEKERADAIEEAKVVLRARIKIMGDPDNVVGVLKLIGLGEKLGLRWEALVKQRTEEHKQCVDSKKHWQPAEVKPLAPGEKPKRCRYCHARVDGVTIIEDKGLMMRAAHEVLADEQTVRYDGRAPTLIQRMAAGFVDKDQRFPSKIPQPWRTLLAFAVHDIGALEAAMRLATISAGIKFYHRRDAVDKLPDQISEEGRRWTFG